MTSKIHMLPWRDIGIREDAFDREAEARRLASTAVQQIMELPGERLHDQTTIVSRVVADYLTSVEETKVVLHWDDVPREKRHRDYEASMRALFFGYRKPLPMTEAEIDQDIARLRGSRDAIEFDKRFSFFHSIDTVIAHARRERFSRADATSFLLRLMEGKVLHDPLYLRVMLQDTNRLGIDGRSYQELAEAMVANHHHDGFPDDVKTIHLTGIEDEGAVSRQFFKTRPEKVVLRQRFAIHAPNGQAAEKLHRTYAQVAEKTAMRLASLVTYGLVAGGVIGGINPTKIFGTVDRADLCIINWYPDYQGALLVPIDAYAKPGFHYMFTNSMSTMVDGDKASGIDVIVDKDGQGILPEIQPKEFVVLVPVPLQEKMTAEISRLGRLLRRSEEEMSTTAQRCIVYRPDRWKNIHYVNEWLQTTREGNALLEERLGRGISDLLTLQDTKPRIFGGIYCP